jgi:hypothetical protein
MNALPGRVVGTTHCFPQRRCFVHQPLHNVLACSRQTPDRVLAEAARNKRAGTVSGLSCSSLCSRRSDATPARGGPLFPLPSASFCPARPVPSGPTCVLHPVVSGVHKFGPSPRSLAFHGLWNRQKRRTATRLGPRLCVPRSARQCGMDDSEPLPDERAFLPHPCPSSVGGSGSGPWNRTRRIVCVLPPSCGLDQLASAPFASASSFPVWTRTRTRTRPGPSLDPPALVLLTACTHWRPFRFSFLSPSSCHVSPSVWSRTNSGEERERACVVGAAGGMTLAMCMSVCLHSALCPLDSSSSAPRILPAHTNASQQ